MRGSAVESRSPSSNGITLADLNADKRIRLIPEFFEGLVGIPLRFWCKKSKRPIGDLFESRVFVKDVNPRSGTRLPPPYRNQIASERYFPVLLPPTSHRTLTGLNSLPFYCPFLPQSGAVWRSPDAWRKFHKKAVNLCLSRIYG